MGFQETNSQSVETDLADKSVIFQRMTEFSENEPTARFKQDTGHTKSWISKLLSEREVGNDIYKVYVI